MFRKQVRKFLVYDPALAQNELNKCVILIQELRHINFHPPCIDHGAQ